MSRVILYIIGALFICCSAAPLQPVVMNNLDQRFAQQRRQQTINDIADELTRMTDKIYYQKNTFAPRPHPALEPLLADAVKAIKKSEKATIKQGKDSKAAEELNMFSQLMDSIKHINKRLDPKPDTSVASTTLHDKKTLQLLDIPQPQEMTEEQQALTEQSHAQSRLLHHMTHVIDRLGSNTQNDLDRKVKYQRMMNRLMHEHLTNPRYHDSLHDHLLAHHLTAPHTNDEFEEHLAQHLLYHDIGRKAENEFLHSTPSSTPGNADLPVTAKLLNIKAVRQENADLAQRQKAAITQNHLSTVAEQRENHRRTNANNFAEQSYEKFKDYKL